MRSLLILIALLLTLVELTASAQIAPAPGLLNFQGRLARPDGTPVADGTYSVRFSLWDAASGGTEKWNQAVNPMTVKNGTFSALLSGFPADTFAGNIALRQRGYSAAYIREIKSTFQD